MRILNVAAFAVSGYASTDGRNCKPFNPLLGETYEADYPDKGVRFISEKVTYYHFPFSKLSFTILLLVYFRYNSHIISLSRYPCVLEL